MFTKACALFALWVGANALTLGVDDPIDFNKEKTDDPVQFPRARESESEDSDGPVKFPRGQRVEEGLVSQEYRMTLVRQLQAYTFEDYVKEHEKEYVKGTPVFNRRAAIFLRNKRQIIRFAGLNKLTWTPTINKFMDLTKAEFKAKLGHKIDRSNSLQMARQSNPKHKHLEEVPVNFVLEKSFDWRSKMKYSAEFQKDQGACGSCWAVATVAAIEAHADIHYNVSMPLSAQEVVSCTPNPKHCGGTGGCDGATAELALDWLSAHEGMVVEEQYQYTSKWGMSGTCDMEKIKKPAVFIGGYTSVPSNNANAMMYALTTKGPLVVAVDAKLWSFYGGGIFNSCPRDATINHAVVLVGYGFDGSADEKSKAYWLLRNSWGRDWGLDGYIQITRSIHPKSEKFCGMDKFPQEGSACEGDNEPVKVCGMCGILYEPVLPLVTGVEKPKNFDEIIAKSRSQRIIWEKKLAVRKIRMNREPTVKQ